MRSLVSIVEKRRVVRARDLYRSGIHPEVVSRALQRALLLKIGRGLSTRLSSDLKYRQISSKVEANSFVWTTLRRPGPQCKVVSRTMSKFSVAYRKGERFFLRWSIPRERPLKGGVPYHGRIGV
jgi:hypothetical protein